MNAKQTIYNGNLYRSRTECAWAVLLDLAGIGFTYEPEKIEGYWPDFKLQNGRHLEIKARRATPEELHKGAAVKNLVFLCGRPKPAWEDGRVEVMGWVAAQVSGPDRVRYFFPKPSQANDTLAAIIDCDPSRIEAAGSRFLSKWEEIKLESDREMQVGGIGTATIARALAEAFGKPEQWTPRTHTNF